MSLHVHHINIRAALINVGTRDVWFNEAGVSRELTQIEFERLLSIDGFVEADAPLPTPSVEELTFVAPFCGTELPATEAEAEAGFLETLTCIPLPEPDVTPELRAEETPPPAEPPVIDDALRATWPTLKVAEKLALADLPWTYTQFSGLIDLENAGKANLRVLDLLDRRYHAAKPKQTPDTINQALLKASAGPVVTEE